jgi:hypothetical protein
MAANIPIHNIKKSTPPATIANRQAPKVFMKFFIGLVLASIHAILLLLSLGKKVTPKIKTFVLAWSTSLSAAAGV